MESIPFAQMDMLNQNYYEKAKLGATYVGNLRQVWAVFFNALTASWSPPAFDFS